MVHIIVHTLGMSTVLEDKRSGILRHCESLIKLIMLQSHCPCYFLLSSLQHHIEIVPDFLLLEGRTRADFLQRKLQSNASAIRSMSKCIRDTITTWKQEISTPNQSPHPAAKHNSADHFNPAWKTRLHRKFVAPPALQWHTALKKIWSSLGDRQTSVAKFKTKRIFVERRITLKKARGNDGQDMRL
jgi:hypothetical protein